jgi:opacity protein-like surface antigen
MNVTHLMKASVKCAIAALLLAASGLRSNAEGFVRPEIAYLRPTTDVDLMFTTGTRLKSAFGFGAAFGAALGANKEHELSLNVAVANGFKASESTQTAFSVPGAPHSSYTSGSDEAKVDTVPVLADYRYYFQPRREGARFYAGGTLGFTHMKYSETARGNYAGGSDVVTINDSKNGFTWGLGVGFTVNIGSSTDWDLGYRFSSAQAWDGHVNLHALYTGVSCRF